ncbi:hypothetical protein NVP1244A_144 [Vibrio phage 1.244.A._10N.261.54.C3]|nr:hypothetical protein NVP1244A_144 [Vibrio phage 1.244.A._10N.261.54.C3]AUR98772.1 hypothetical protein NVP1255O_144 [Vibrio phage 1.255.O._10N.286.45.F1]
MVSAAKALIAMARIQKNGYNMADPIHVLISDSVPILLSEDAEGHWCEFRSLMVEMADVAEKDNNKIEQFLGRSKR